MSAYRLLVIAAALCLTSWAFCQDDQNDKPSPLEANQPADSPVDVLWQVQFGTAGPDRVAGLAIDGEGACYAVGSTNDWVAGASAPRDADIFLCKYDRNGERLWLRRTDAPPLNDEAVGVALDTGGNCLVTGWTFGAIAGSHVGKADVFLLKYDGEGSLVWSQQFGSDEHDKAYGIAVDSEGNSYICGVTSGDMTGSSSEPPSGDIFIAKYDSDGSAVWVRQFGSDADDRAQAIAVAQDGIIYVTGVTKGDIGGENQGGEDAFILYLDSEGEWLSCEQFGTPEADYALDIVVDADGNCYVVGRTEGELAGSTGAGDIFIAKYDADLVQQWLVQTGAEEPTRRAVLALDPTGGLVVAGSVGTIAKEAWLAETKSDVFIMKCDDGGQQEWLRQFNTDTVDGVSAVAVDADGKYYLAGSTYGALAGDHQGGADAFIIVLSPTDSSSDDEVTEDGP